MAPDADLIVGKVLNNEGEGQDDQILDGIDWAADFGAKIISMSLGSERAAGQPFATPYERLAERLLASGVLFVAAAGNESNRPFSTAAVGNPAACPSIMAVAAVDRNRQVASFSCAQLDGIGTLDISGPGVAVYFELDGWWVPFDQRNEHGDTACGGSRGPVPPEEPEPLGSGNLEPAHVPGNPPGQPA